VIAATHFDFNSGISQDRAPSFALLVLNSEERKELVIEAVSFASGGLRVI
jgi:hypothetical protein